MDTGTTREADGNEAGSDASLPCSCPFGSLMTQCSPNEYRSTLFAQALGPASDSGFLDTLDNTCTGLCLCQFVPAHTLHNRWVSSYSSGRRRATSRSSGTGQTCNPLVSSSVCLHLLLYRACRLVDCDGGSPSLLASGCSSVTHLFFSSP